jgi:hypothetical protein
MNLPIVQFPLTLLPCHFPAQISSSVPYSWTFSAYGLSSVQKTKFQTHTKQAAACSVIVEYNAFMHNCLF